MEPSETKLYEISFLVKDEKGGEEILKLLKRSGADVALEGTFERIPLAYPIEKETAAFFGYFHFRAAPNVGAALQREMQTHPAALRFLILTSPYIKPKPREARPFRETQSAPAVRLPAERIERTERKRESAPLSNEALEKKIEEILQE